MAATHRIDFARLRAEEGDAYIGARIEAMLEAELGTAIPEIERHRLPLIAGQVKLLLLRARNDELTLGAQQSPRYYELAEKLLQTRRYIAELEAEQSDITRIDGTIVAGVFEPADNRHWPILHTIGHDAAIAPAVYAHPIGDLP